jgi:hypothetical protein
MQYQVKLWERPDHYMGKSWPDYYVGLARHRDSDCLTESNFQQCLEMLGGESDTVRIVREGHWAVGWVEWIAVHQDNEKGVETLREIESALADYPVLDDEGFYGMEQKEADSVWRDCYTPKERVDYIRRNRSQFDFCDFSQMMAVVRGEYFNGYASELIY